MVCFLKKCLKKQLSGKGPKQKKLEKFFLLWGVAVGGRGLNIEKTNHGFASALLTPCDHVLLSTKMLRSHLVSTQEVDS